MKTGPAWPRRKTPIFTGSAATGPTEKTSGNKIRIGKVQSTHGWRFIVATPFYSSDRRLTTRPPSGGHFLQRHGCHSLGVAFNLLSILTMPPRKILSGAACTRRFHCDAHDFSHA